MEGDGNVTLYHDPASLATFWCGAAGQLEGGLHHHHRHQDTKLAASPRPPGPSHLPRNTYRRLASISGTYSHRWVQDTICLGSNFSNRTKHTETDSQTTADWAQFPPVHDPNLTWAWKFLGRVGKVPNWPGTQVAAGEDRLTETLRTLPSTVHLTMNYLIIQHMIRSRYTRSMDRVVELYDKI